MPYLPPAVDAPHQVVALFEQLVDLTDAPQTVALIIDRWGHALTAMQRSGPVPCDDLLDLCTICSSDDNNDGDGDTGEIELLVIASWRPGRGATPSDDDERCWASMLERTDGGAVHLVDWLLIDGDDVTSMSGQCGR